MRRLSKTGSSERTPEGNVEKNDGKIDDDKSKKKKNNLIKDYIIDYTANSNLHGLKYIGEKERSFIEKIFWLSALICCVGFCALLIRNVWNKWDLSPVIVSFAENPTPVWQIPYPAVTVCIETKSMQTKFNYTNHYHLYRDNTTFANLTEEIINLFEDVSMVCDDHLAPRTGRKFSPGNELVSNIKEVSPNLSEVFLRCKWKDITYEDCSSLFSPIITEEGLCYTFNILAADELFRMENLQVDYPYLENNKRSESWTLDEGYAPDTPIETYPHRGSGYGAKAGLTFLLKANYEDLDYLCKGPVQGFKILLHNAAELPRLSQQYFRCPLSHEMVVAVKPNMMTTSEGLKPYDPLRRKCYFPTERYLQYFKIYTQPNCEMECLSNFTYTRCGCVHFGMPHGPNMSVCNSGSMDCIKKAQQELVTIAIKTERDIQEVNDTEAFNHARDVAANCQCIPACTSIEYEAENSQADYDWEALSRAQYKINMTQGAGELAYTHVMIFFKESQFITSRRSELYGQTDFMANCGGLLGLFMGFSILSVVEILYFMTLRLCCVLKQRVGNKKSMNFNSEIDITHPKSIKDMLVD